MFDCSKTITVCYIDGWLHRGWSQAPKESGRVLDPDKKHPKECLVYAPRKVVSKCWLLLYMDKAWTFMLSAARIIWTVYTFDEGRSGLICAAVLYAQSPRTDMNVELYVCRASFVFAININVGFSSVCETQPYYAIYWSSYFLPHITLCIWNKAQFSILYTLYLFSWEKI